MKKIFIFIFTSFLAVNIFGIESQAQQNESVSWDVPGIYSVDIYDETWGEMTFAEQLEEVALPEEIVDSLSTEAMAEWVLAYPFLGDLCLFDSANASMDYFSRTSYLFRSFFAREDVKKVLLDKYADLRVDYNMLADGNADSGDLFTESGYFKELFLQSYFATVLEELSESEKMVLKDILEEKYIEKSGLCDEFTTATLFYQEVLAEQGEIPDELMFQADLFPYEFVGESQIADSALAYAEGFTNSGQVIATNGGYYYVGVYNKYGVFVNCFMFYLVDLTPEEAKGQSDFIATHHPSWTKVSDPTIKFNCHSYAWIQQSTSNVYWLDNPRTFASSSSFSYVGSNGGANSGDHIIVTNVQGQPQHSLIAVSTGTDCNSVNTISKCGKAGIYYAMLADIFLAYGNEYEVYR